MTDYILSMHQHAYDSIDVGVSFDEMIAYLKANKINTTYHKEAIIRAYGDIFFSPSDGEIKVRSTAYTGNKSRTAHHMAPEAYFRYLSFLEYKQANKNAEQSQRASRTAINYAKWALVVSILVGVAQIVIQIKYS